MASGASMRSRRIQALSGRCTAPVVANTFIGFNYNTCANITKALGVSEFPYNSGELVDVVDIGTAYITLAATLAVGAPVTSDATGKAIAAGANPVNGYMIEAGVSGDICEVKLV